MPASRRTAGPRTAFPAESGHDAARLKPAFTAGHMNADSAPPRSSFPLHADPNVALTDIVHLLCRSLPRQFRRTPHVSPCPSAISVSGDPFSRRSPRQSTLTYPRLNIGFDQLHSFGFRFPPSYAERQETGGFRSTRWRPVSKARNLRFVAVPIGHGWHERANVDVVLVLTAPSFVHTHTFLL